MYNTVTIPHCGARYRFGADNSALSRCVVSTVMPMLYLTTGDLVSRMEPAIILCSLALK